MEYISSAGVAYLARNNLNIDRMIDRWKRGSPIIFGPKFLDYDFESDAPYGHISFRKNLWRVDQRYGRFRYWELGS